MLVKDVMTAAPVTTRADASVKEALMLLSHNGVTSLPVIDRTGRILGVVSEADLIRDAVPLDPRARVTPADSPGISPPHNVAEVMTTHAVTVHVNTDLASAVELMTSTSVKALPVVDGRDRVVGVVSRSDVVDMLARADTTIAHEVDALLESLGHNDWLVEVHDGVVDVNGPDSLSERSLADVAARTVAGVVEVRVGGTP